MELLFKNGVKGQSVISRVSQSGRLSLSGKGSDFVVSHPIESSP
jgi:hypothetical protein